MDDIVTMKILRFGAAVLESDTHISKWVEESGTLGIAEPLLRSLRHLIPFGSVVLDIGANIGDHTFTLSSYVGKEGIVHCFEPNLEAYECLMHNITHFNLKASSSPVALSDKNGEKGIQKEPNSGASYLIEGAGTSTITLDSLHLAPNFIKIDAEGYELFILKGGLSTIRKHKPAMLIEIQRTCLKRNGCTAEQIFALLSSLGYTIEREDPRIPWQAEQYDIICKWTGNTELPKIPLD